jgi:hypothetical protein
MANTKMQPFNPTDIPQALKDLPRWAVWRAVWNEKREKFDKIPHCPVAPFYGISTAKPQEWRTFALAQSALTRNADRFAGLGLVLTGLEGYTFLDLDHCLVDGQLSVWADELVQQLGTYTEVSPSGTGLRMVMQGRAPADWTNHERGLEVYAGHEPRYLTFTGQVWGSPRGISPVTLETLEQLGVRYGKPADKTADIITIALPDLLDELAVPDLATLDLPARTREFLVDGLHSGDRSRELFIAGIALYKAGLDDAEVLSLLWASDHVREVALDHRRQDPDRALLYLWRETCCKGKARAAQSALVSVEDFEVLDSEPATDKTIKPQRFPLIPAATFASRKAPDWLIKHVLPDAELLMLFGESTAGKSFVALDLCCAIARGVAWRGHKTRQGRVVMVVAEGAGGFRNRLQAYAQHNNCDLSTFPLDIIEVVPNLLIKDDALDLARGILAGGPVALLVIDTFAQTTPGSNENSGEDMGRALAHCKGIHRATKAPVLLVHHAGKDLSRGARGWSGLRAAADAELEISRDGDYRAIRITKGKDGEDGREWPFALETITVGIDEDGEDITSCVVSHVEGSRKPMARRKPEPKGSKQRLVATVLADMEGLGEGVPVADLVDACVAQIAHDEGKRDTRRQHVLQAINSMVEAGAVELANGCVLSA